MNEQRAPIDLASLPARLDRLATPTSSRLGAIQPQASFLRQLVQLTEQVLRADVVVCHTFGFVADPAVAAESDSLVVGSMHSIDESIRAECANLATTAAQSLRTEVRRSASSFLIATVARQADQLQVVVTRIRPGDQAIEPFVLTQQLITGAITTWDERRRREQLSDQYHTEQWTTEFNEAIDSSENWRQLCHRIVDIIAIDLQAHQVALCTQRSQRNPLMDVAAVGGSGSSVNGDQWQLVAAETVMRKSVTCAPQPPEESDESDESADRVATIAHQQLARSVSDHHRAVSIPIADPDGTIRNVLIIVIDQQQSIDEFRIQWIHQHLAARIARWESAHQSLPQRLCNSLKRNLPARRGALAALILTLVVAMFPARYQVGGEAVLVPQTKNYVVAPHNGSIHKIYARVGDVIAPGSTIAELDDRELRIEMSALIAERDRAAKQRDVYRAEGRIADEQLAEAELARVEQKIRLAKHRLDNLIITSPIGGVILTGELDGVTGAAVETGQVLAEVADLDRLWIEVEVPQDELGEIREGQTVRVALDADVVSNLRATIESISPGAQVRGERSIFIARAVAENPNHQLRPGLTGRAKIASDRRPFWKIVFRRVQRSLGRLWV